MKNRRIFIVFALSAIVVSALFFALEFKQFLDLKHERTEVEKRIERLAARRDRLNAFSNSVRTGEADEKHAEQLIREKLGLIKRGEKIFIFRRQ
ncbi:MAG: hypothetical protein GKS04_00660 [Candidatus Mycalebacterium zealandia]|nr:MAG: hypothetical protein GKS04_00660 [Candidatus Mycalebacterium zealandia]